MDEYQAGDEGTAPPPPPPPAPVEGQKSHAGFRIDEWNGYPNYHCPVCDVGYLDEDDVISHILQFHRNQKLLTNFQMVLPAPNVAAVGGTPYTKLKFTGYVTGFEITAPVNGVLGADTRIKVTGQPAWA